MSGFSLDQDELDECIKDAREAGFEIITADQHTLLLDLDTEFAYKLYASRVTVLHEHYDVRKIEQWLSKSGKNRHVRITMGESWDAPTRYAFQAALGSDGMRELLALVQLRNGCDEPCILFKPPTSEIKVLYDCEQPDPE